MTCQNCFNGTCPGCTDTENDKGRVMVKVVQRDDLPTNQEVWERFRKNRGSDE